MLGWRSEITQRPLLYVTQFLIHAKNHPRLSTFSPSVNAKTRGNNWLFLSHPMVIITMPLYFPFKCVPSIFSIGWQCLKPSMERRNAQKTRWNTSSFHILLVNVLEITTHPGFPYSKAPKKMLQFSVWFIEITKQIS